MTNVKISCFLASNLGTLPCPVGIQARTRDRRQPRVLLTTFLLLLVCASAGNLFGAQTLTVGTNINITKSAANNSEECISINPLNPNQLFASETWSLATKYSTNGGVTWLNSNISTLGANIGDVSSAWD